MHDAPRDDAHAPDLPLPESAGEGGARYLVTARKYRPQTFGDLVAQEHVAATLRNALTTGRLAHAYLFSGPRGVGKTTAARILAKAINCQTPLAERPGAEPCRACEACRSFEAGRALNVLELDAASNNSVNDIRDLRDTVRVPPQGAAKKVYILDEVHMLSASAFNALLKTLEEPPPYVVFIFATTEPHKVLPTILSRTQRFDFRRIAVGEIVARLRAICAAEGVEADEESLVLIARKGDGALRDALSLFDQAVAICGTSLRGEALREALGVVASDLFFRVTDHARAGERAGLLTLVDELVRRGYDLKEFLHGLAEHLRDLLAARTLGSADLIEATEATRGRYLAAAPAWAEADLLHLLMLADQASRELRDSRQPRLTLELALLKMASLEGAADLQRLLRRLEGLEKGGAAPSGGGEGGARPAARPEASPGIPARTQASAQAYPQSSSSPARASEPSAEASAPPAQASAPPAQASTPSSQASAPSAEGVRPTAEASRPHAETPQPSAPSSRLSAPLAQASGVLPQALSEPRPPSVEASPPPSQAAPPSPEASRPPVEASRPVMEASRPSPPPADEGFAPFAPPDARPADSPYARSEDAAEASPRGRDDDEGGEPALPSRPQPAPLGGPAAPPPEPSRGPEPAPRPLAADLFGRPALRRPSGPGPGALGGGLAGGHGDGAAGLPALPTAADDALGASLVRVRDVWPRLVTSVRTENVALGAVLVDARPVRVRRGAVEVALGSPFDCEIAERGREAVEATLAGLAGPGAPPLRFVVAPREAQETAVEADPFERLKQLRQEHPVVRALFERFGAEIVWS